MSTSRQQDRSLGSGISLPQWMKGKTDNRFDFDDAAFSPPSYDDSFFYVRYKKSQTSDPSKEGSKRIVPEVSSENSTRNRMNQTTTEKSIHDSKEVKIDLSKHPLPCQPFISDIGSRESATSKHAIPKSQGTDDGFHGESALCGKSIVHVATRMTSGKPMKVLASDSRFQQMENSSRSISKSLPATPSTSPTGSPDTSPKTRRKMHANRYFTGAFVPDRDKYQGNWILASILGQSREIITAKIEEEDEILADAEPRKPLNRKRSISSQNLTYMGTEERSADKTVIDASIMEAKPSELREMNFWSPTSM